MGCGVSMEQTVKREKSILKKVFYRYVFVTLTVIVIFSAVTIFACVYIQRWLLPDDSKCYLTIEKTYADGETVVFSYLMQMGENPEEKPILETRLNGQEDSTDEAQNIKYSIEPVEKSPKYLTPKRKLLYDTCSVAMIAVPVLLSFGGILLCGTYFYKRRLREPIRILSNGAEKIANRNLDFRIEYPVPDEFGTLCESFEMMRDSLATNNREMWRMIEDRKRLQASVAHDLRTPITVIKGYAEYLNINLATGKLTEDKISGIVNKIKNAADRMEDYTEAVRNINHMEDMQPDRKEVEIRKYICDFTADAENICRFHKVKLTVGNDIARETVFTDTTMISRILENILSNSVRYAKNQINICFFETEDEWGIEIADDGDGLSDEILSLDFNVTHPKSEQEGHLGMGLYLCQTLCHKLGGTMQIGNSDTGAYVKIVLPEEK